MHRYSCKLRLLQHGLAKEAEIIDDIDLQYVDNNLNDGEGGNDVAYADEDEIINRRIVFLDNAIKSIALSNCYEEECHGRNESISERRISIIKNFLSDIAKVKKCARCDG